MQEGFDLKLAWKTESNHLNEEDKVPLDVNMLLSNNAGQRPPLDSVKYSFSSLIVNLFISVCRTLRNACGMLLRPNRLAVITRCRNVAFLSLISSYLLPLQLPVVQERSSLYHPLPRALSRFHL